MRRNSYTPKERPSGHDISEGFGKDNGGAIPSNLLQIANCESNGTYQRLCKEFGIKPHSTRFPRALPEFFIKFLTDPDDLVLDIFGGSGTTGEAAELLRRQWRTIDLDPEYVAASIFVLQAIVRLVRLPHFLTPLKRDNRQS